LLSNASDVVISVPNNASIIIDGEYKGQGSWSGGLGVGTYVVEAKLKNYKTIKQQITISEINKKYEFPLKSLEPILSSLSVESDPVGASISLDGKTVGTTPYHINDLIIGSHEIVLSKNGYNDYKKTVNISETGENKLTAKLDNFITVTINSDPKNALVYFNNEFVGATPYTYTGEKKQIDLTLKCDGYQTINETIDANKSITKNYRMKLTDLEKKQNIDSSVYVYAACRISGAVGAMIYVDGKYVGKTTYEIEGAAGSKHNVQIKYVQPKAKTQNVTITLGEDTYYYGGLEFDE
jgi:hypothetical protein